MCVNKRDISWNRASFENMVHLRVMPGRKFVTHHWRIHLINIKIWIPAFAGMTVLVVFFSFQSIAFAQISLDSINQKVCDRFEEDVARMAAIMEEYRDRNGIKETRVAFGGIDTNVKSADYWITYGAEAIAYQRIQKYSNTSGLRSSLEILAGKILRAKKQVGKVLDEQ